MKEDIFTVLNAVKRRLELEAMSGVRELIAPSRPRGQEAEDRFLELKKTASACVKCDLYKTRTHVVFGAGDPRAHLMFVGEAPGMEEDLQGLPFVGKAGQLLTKIIEAIGFKRKDVYIANILKCRPPANRNPLPTEVLACQDYLFEQIGLVRPKVICALGKFASLALLKTDEPITKLRGRFYDFKDGILLMPTFHPAYLLRNPGDKKLVWEDMKKIKKALSDR